eukprot:4350421-Amphidinium_carterae.1
MHKYGFDPFFNPSIVLWRFGCNTGSSDFDVKVRFQTLATSALVPVFRHNDDQAILSESDC